MGIFRCGSAAGDGERRKDKWGGKGDVQFAVDGLYSCSREKRRDVRVLTMFWMVTGFYCSSKELDI
jgi:hypothetical protein